MAVLECASCGYIHAVKSCFWLKLTLLATGQHIKGCHRTSRFCKGLCEDICLQPPQLHRALASMPADNYLACCI